MEAYTRFNSLTTFTHLQSLMMTYFDVVRAVFPFNPTASMAFGQSLRGPSRPSNVWSRILDPDKACVP